MVRQETGWWLQAIVSVNQPTIPHSRQNRKWWLASYPPPSGIRFTSWMGSMPPSHSVTMHTIQNSSSPGSWRIMVPNRRPTHLQYIQREQGFTPVEIMPLRLLPLSNNRTPRESASCATADPLSALPVTCGTSWVQV